MFLHIQFTLMLLMWSFAAAEIKLACVPGEVSKPYTFTFSVSQDAKYVTWRKDNMIIADCILSDCSFRDTSMYAVSRSGQTCSLSILNVTVYSSGFYSCDTENNRYTCDFTAFAKPDRVLCQDGEFQAQPDTVNVVCTAQRVYPYPKCQFTRFLNGTQIIPVNSLITYNNMPPTGNDDYFTAKCSFKLRAYYFSVGSHQFQVRVYPNVTGSDNDTVYGIDSSRTSPQYVDMPSVKLECPGTSPYVEEGKPFNCTCRETANNFTLSTTWLCYGTTTNSSTQNVTARFIAQRNTTENTFPHRIYYIWRHCPFPTCVGYIPFGGYTQKTQTVQVAYGPSIVALRVIYNQTESDVIRLCDQPVTVTATCSVPANNSNPGVNYQFYSNVSDSMAGPSRIATVNYTIRSGGLFKFLCTANNSQFSWLSATSINKIIQVIAPPSPPVIEKYQDGGTPVVAGDQLTVQEGVAKIRCRAEGGYPPGPGLLLECGSQISTENNLYIDVNFSRHMDGTTCSCTATHSSLCYTHNKALTMLNVHFGPSIFNFEANNSQKIIVERNSIVSFSCQAEGNPSPRLSLRKNGAELSAYNDATHRFYQTLTYSKSLTECLDAGVYMCLAEGGQRTTNKTVAVYVKCKPEFRNPDNLSKIHKQRVNGTALIYVPVFGYPEPTVTLSSTKYILASDVYNLAYLKQEPPYGTVSLAISIKNESFFQNYSLHIDNIEGSLIYQFEIVEGDPAMSEFKEVPELNVGAVIGGVIAGVLVLAAAVLFVIYLKRRGLFRNKSNENRFENSMVNFQHKDTKVSEELPEAQAPEIPHYEEIVDVRSGLPDQPVYYINHILPNIKDEEPEYENAVCGL